MIYRKIKRSAIYGWSLFFILLFCVFEVLGLILDRLIKEAIHMIGTEYILKEIDKVVSEGYEKEDVKKNDIIMIYMLIYILMMCCVLCALFLNRMNHYIVSATIFTLCFFILCLDLDIFDKFESVFDKIIVKYFIPIIEFLSKSMSSIGLVFYLILLRLSNRSLIFNDDYDFYMMMFSLIQIMFCVISFYIKIVYPIFKK